MNYLVWAVVALVGYSAFVPLASLATKQMPSHVTALVTNTMLACSALALTVVRGDDAVEYLSGRPLVYTVAAGVFLSVGILAYYRALSQGPVSVVTPIYGSFLVGASVLGIVFLDEPFSLAKGVGIVLTMAGVYLVAS
ncbi:EamA family transporter [Halobium salinum]|uniref:EamA family transporter n=1 Tax=Halobium salinum TaxID=1364940 RepID=A0ABD5PFM0_9EURY|nr:EamA family transporter [Halobium salinum]